MALVILTIGLTSVIALFPVGVNRVRNATLDTRTTIMASNAHSLFHLKRMANDPAIVDLAAYDVLRASGQTKAAEFVFDDPVRNPLAFTPWSPQAGGWWPDPVATNLPTDHVKSANAVFAAFLRTVPPPLPLLASPLNLSPDLVPRGGDPNESTALNWMADFRERLLAEEDDVFGLFAGGIARTDAQDVPSDYNLSYPVLLDPYLFDAMAIQFGLLSTSGTFGFTGGVPRINIATNLTRSDGTTLVPGFENFYGSSGGTGPRPFADIAVLSLSEITLLPFASVSLDRETVKARWFASTADVNYISDVPGQPTNPSSQDFLEPSVPPLTPQYYLEAVPGDTTTPLTATNPPSLSNPVRLTAQRDYEYTWGAMFQRRLVPPKEGGANEPMVARPSLSDREFRGKLAILCFYRRNLQQPYRVIEGCFYTGSRVVTLSWPSTLTAPTVNVGTWLCEASVSRSTTPQSLSGVNPDPLLGSTATLSGLYVDDDPAKVVDYLAPPLGTIPSIAGRRIYRRAFSFHRVSGVGEAVEDAVSGRTYLQVTIERPAVGFPLQYQNPATGLIGAQSGQDDRPIDAYTTPASWPIIDRQSSTGGILAAGTNDETNCSQAQLKGIAAVPPNTLGTSSFYYPVIIFDGLREVFEYNTD